MKHVLIAALMLTVMQPALTAQAGLPDGHFRIGVRQKENGKIDSPAFTGGGLSAFKLRLSRVFLTLLGDVPANDLFGDPHRGHKVAL